MFLQRDWGNPELTNGYYWHSTSDWCRKKFRVECRHPCLGDQMTEMGTWSKLKNSSNLYTRAEKKNNFTKKESLYNCVILCWPNFMLVFLTIFFPHDISLDSIGFSGEFFISCLCLRRSIDFSSPCPQKGKQFHSSFLIVKILTMEWLPQLNVLF